MMLQPLVLVALLSLTWTAAGWPCTQIFPSQPPPSSVNRVKPTDVAAFASIGLHPHSTEMTIVLSRLTELLNLLSPNLISLVSEDLIEDASQFTQRSSLVEEAQQVVLHLHRRQDVDVSGDWKLVLLLVRVDLLSVCQHHQQVASIIRETVNEVDNTLQLLHSQLKRTIVSVALWDGGLPPERPCGVETNTEGEVRLWRASLTQALQESLDQLLVQRRRYEDRDDFTVTLQDVPMLAGAGAATTSRLISDRLTVQMWTNLLQPTAGRPDSPNNGVLQCPSEERPYLRTQGNSPSYHHDNHIPRLLPLLHPSTGTEMPCEDFSPSPSTPTTVHELRPADVRVVAAVGDSLTAGNGIASGQTNILDVLREYRGLSWSVGGNKNLTTVTTLPNILKYFNHNLTGYSVGIGKQDTPQAFLNQAVSGAKSNNVPDQVKKLVARMKNDSRIDFEEDWKVITFFIGGNDICAYCDDSLLYSVDNYSRHVQESLDYLHKQVPRALVNLIEPLHIIPLREMHLDSSIKCPTWLVNLLCSCVIQPEPNSTALQKLEDVNRGYQRVLKDLVGSGRYDSRPDFTVVVQPLFREVVIPKLPDGRPDRSYFSADCFHLSQKAQTQMARALWNNMLEPVGNKTSGQDFTTSITLKCPTKASPFIFTKVNSQPSPPVPTTTTTTTTPITTSASVTPFLKCPASVSVWVPVVVGMVSLLAGVAIAWFILSYTRQRRNQMTLEGVEGK